MKAPLLLPGDVFFDKAMGEPVFVVSVVEEFNDTDYFLCLCITNRNIERLFIEFNAKWVIMCHVR